MSSAMVLVGLVLTHCKFGVVFGSQSSPILAPDRRTPYHTFSSLQCGCDWVQESILFSTLSEFPSRINAGISGSIHEGELGYILDAALRVIVDGLGLVVSGMVRDRGFVLDSQPCTWLYTSAQSQANHTYPLAPTVCANPSLRKNLPTFYPVIQINRFKISERTTYGPMDDKEIGTSFARYGHQARLIRRDLGRIGEGMASSLEWTMGAIHSVQKAACQDKPVFKPTWPVLALRTLK